MNIHDIGKAFQQRNQNHSLTAEAGKKAALILYNDRITIDIRNLPYQILANKTVTAKLFVEPKQLPPTKTSLKYHSYRNYLQVQKRINLKSPKVEE